MIETTQQIIQNIRIDKIGNMTDKILKKLKLKMSSGQ